MPRILNLLFYSWRRMNLAEFDYHLPEELIAQQPLADRAASRMLVVHRAEGRWEDRPFANCRGICERAIAWSLNDSQVFPSRLYGRRKGVHAGQWANTIRSDGRI